MYKLNGDDLLEFGFQIRCTDGYQDYICTEELLDEIGIDISVSISHKTRRRDWWEATAFHCYKDNDFEIRLFDVSNMTPKAIVDLLVEMRNKFFE